jgi:biopolymer transport protein ExbD
MPKRRLRREPAHLEIIAFINLIVVLVPFLLSTAVFSRLSVMDLSLPAPGVAGALDQIKAGELQLEVVIRPEAYEVGDRVGGLIQRVARSDDRLALKMLNATIVEVKRRHPTKKEVSVLAEPLTSYDALVQVMDAVRSAPTAEQSNGSTRIVQAELFPDIAVGDAPVRSAAGAAQRAAAAASGALPTLVTTLPAAPAAPAPGAKP